MPEPSYRSKPPSRAPTPIQSGGREGEFATTTLQERKASDEVSQGGLTATKEIQSLSTRFITQSLLLQR